MTEDELKTRLQRELPALLREDAVFRAWLEQLIRDLTVPRTAFEERFDRFMNELAAAREREDTRWEEQRAAAAAERERADAKWEKQTQENHAIWAEIKAAREREDTRWAAQQQKDDKLFAELAASRRRQDQQFGAMGARWGIASEQSFRDALRGILHDSFGVEVVNINDYDDEGLVFGRPDQVEIDIIIHNGQVIACELKSSMSKGDMYIFDRKAEFYTRRHRRPVERRIVISPMMRPSARAVASQLGIEVFSYAEDATGLDGA